MRHIVILDGGEVNSANDLKDFIGGFLIDDMELAEKIALGLINDGWVSVVHIARGTADAAPAKPKKVKPV